MVRGHLQPPYSRPASVIGHTFPTTFSLFQFKLANLIHLKSTFFSGSFSQIANFRCLERLQLLQSSNKNAKVKVISRWYSAACCRVMLGADPWQHLYFIPPPLGCRWGRCGGHRGGGGVMQLPRPSRALGGKMRCQ